jgi:hypothetical protein
MAKLRRRFGFWGAVGRLQLSDLVAPEILFGLALGGSGAWLLVSRTTVTERVGSAGDYLALVAALLGVVFAGFALVISLMSDRYLRLLGPPDDGVVNFLSPFILATGLQVGTILGTVAYRAGAPYLPPKLEPWAFGAISVLFAISVLDVVALARSLMMHGVARAKDLEVHDLQAKRDQRRGTG